MVYNYFFTNNEIILEQPIKGNFSIGSNHDPDGHC